MPESDALEEKLAKDIIRDYRGVAKEVGATAKYHGIPAWATYGCKPWAILTLTIGQEVGMPKRERVACAALVDLGSRAVALADDMIDKELPVTLETMWAQRDCLWGTLTMLSRHERKGILSRENYYKIFYLIEDLQRFMFDGMYWQREHGKLDNKNVTFEEFLEKYLDKICGGLFYWSIIPVGDYHPPAQEQITAAVPAVKNFARVFQMKDDVGDILQDFRENQLTSALFFVRDKPREFERLKSEAKKSERRLSEEEFSKLFPESYEKINGFIRTEEESALQTLVAANIPERYYDTIGILVNNKLYRALRAKIDKKLYGKKPELPKQYTPEERERVRGILRKTRQIQENAAKGVFAAIAVDAERKEHKRMYNPE